MTHPPKSVIHINFMPNALRFKPRRVWTALRKAEELGKLTTAKIDKGPAEYDFIIMRENIHQFQEASPKDYFRLSEFRNVVEGLAHFANAAQRHLVTLLEN